ncbi:uncharacterized protein BDZ99DRAFT_500610 [Mytilinidion resinicola]|uniref:Uncharacterized protein n=1 Tax=Mytilinidion resinicola TaxID=574789 RepID=A0A6A6YFN2_9PEZI|nr:uncharacterized protein BDZ99DRAFT_500610 [Mytilinidion resinicola]KAF2807409.1 hypothetical protein BDZ99DRAFT_500610 [Mytilinidion resinicola]
MSENSNKAPEIGLSAGSVLGPGEETSASENELQEPLSLGQKPREFRFFDLPHELRDLAYSFAWPDDAPRNATIRHSPTSDDCTVVFSAGIPSRVNRQFHTETFPYLLKGHRILVDDSVKLRGLIKWLSSNPTGSSFDAIRHLRFTGNEISSRWASPKCFSSRSHNLQLLPNLVINEDIEFMKLCPRLTTVHFDNHLWKLRSLVGRYYAQLFGPFQTLTDAVNFFHLDGLFECSNLEKIVIYRRAINTTVDEEFAERLQKGFMERGRKVAIRVTG